MNRSEAKMIAEELHKFIRNDVRKAVTEMATAETEEYLNAKQAAVFLGWKLQTLYNRIHDIPHTKNGKSLIFTKSALRKFMESICNRLLLNILQVISQKYGLNL